MLVVVQFEPHHLRLLKVQEGQAYMQADVDNADHALALLRGGPAYTAFVDGRVVCCAGIMYIWPWRATLWSLLSHDAGPHMRAITREVRRVLGALEVKRLEVYVDVGFPAAIRWVEMLDFRRESLLEAFGPGGRDQFMYTRIR